MLNDCCFVAKVFIADVVIIVVVAIVIAVVTNIVVDVTIVVVAVVVAAAAATLLPIFSSVLKWDFIIIQMTLCNNVRIIGGVGVGGERR